MFLYRVTVSDQLERKRKGKNQNPAEFYLLNIPGQMRGPEIASLRLVELDTFPATQKVVDKLCSGSSPLLRKSKS